MLLNLRSTALVIVDVQNDFCHADGALAKRGVKISAMPRMAAANQQLINAFHAVGAPVFFIRTEHGQWTDSVVWKSRVKPIEYQVDRIPVCIEGTWGAEFYGLRPESRDRVVIKRRYSGFYGTDLEISLRALGCVSLAVTGVATNVCVESTVRDAFMRDFDVVLVPEACTANTPEEHQIGVTSIATYFGRIASLETILEEIS